MARFHVRLPDGRLVSGGRAFAELWARLPRLANAGRVLRLGPFPALLDFGYDLFLRVRPWLQRRLPQAARNYPEWLEMDLRSDHAGETGAVAIYTGILAFARGASLRDFASRHRETERMHLALIDERLPETKRSRLLPLWRAAGFTTGALPALFGERAVFRTIDAVETFVDRHYAAQIGRLHGRAEWQDLRTLLERCRADELSHRDEARGALNGPPGLVARLWGRLVGLGSRAGVAVARRI